jgi:hypothetical protein
LKSTRGNLGGNQDDEDGEEQAGEPEFSVIVTVSPPVSPSVVAAILMIQKPSVTSGTLLAKPTSSFSMWNPRSGAAVLSLNRRPWQKFATRAHHLVC